MDNENNLDNNNNDTNFNDNNNNLTDFKSLNLKNNPYQDQLSNLYEVKTNYSKKLNNKLFNSSLNKSLRSQSVKNERSKSINKLHKMLNDPNQSNSKIIFLNIFNCFYLKFLIIIS